MCANKVHVRENWDKIVAHQSPGEHFFYVLGLSSALAEGFTFFQLNAVLTKIEYKEGTTK